MSKKRRKDALEFILNNRIILRKLADSLGCEKNMTDKECRVIIKDMIKRYREENYTDSFSVNMFGVGKKNGNPFKGRYRDDSFDEDWGVSRERSSIPSEVEELIYK